LFLLSPVAGSIIGSEENCAKKAVLGLDELFEADAWGVRLENAIKVPAAT